jgi:hypothetical protein
MKYMLGVILTKEHIEKLCKSLSLEIPKKEKDKSYTIKINDMLEIKIWSLDPGFYFHSNIIQCPQEKREELFTYLMRANLLGQGTARNKIGLDKEEKFLTLSHHISYEVKYIEFKEKLEDFVNYILYWQKEIEKLKKTATIL